MGALSGPPRRHEIETEIGSLNKHKAPGANGLRAEIFQAGGRIIANRLNDDYKAIWPSIEGVSASESVKAKVFQSWQDADVITLFKKGSRIDPNNYRGIFLLDVAGKILAAVVERSIRLAAAPWLGDSQNGFRERRSTSHSIHILRRLQEAVCSANLKTYAVFIDFEKVFDSPPRAALYECLEWIGLPKDLLSIVMAIHEDPKGKLSGSNVWFRIARGIRQGCVQGPTLFSILLEFVKRQANLTDLGIKFKCAEKKQMSLPLDLLGVTFRVGTGEYADDMYALDTSPVRLSEAVNRLYQTSGKIGLKISVKKTKWLYLHNSDSNELGRCNSKRNPAEHCCEQILLDGKPLKHVSSFNYLGST